MIDLRRSGGGTAIPATTQQTSLCPFILWQAYRRQPAAASRAPAPAARTNRTGRAGLFQTG